MEDPNRYSRLSGDSNRLDSANTFQLPRPIAPLHEWSQLDLDTMIAAMEALLGSIKIDEAFEAKRLVRKSRERFRM
jgi:hypothetical protein